MIETNVKICDVCKDRKAKHKCYLCKKDICDVDSIKIRFKKSYDGYELEFSDGKKTEENDVFLCKDCSEKLNKIKVDKGLNKEIVDLLTKYKVIKDL